MNEDTKIYRLLYPHTLSDKIINTQSITTYFDVDYNVNNDM